MNAILAPLAPVDLGKAESPPHRTAQALLAALWDGYAIPPARVRVVVRGQHVQLLGEVDWKYQQQGASRCALALPGILSVDNQLTLTPEASWPGPGPSAGGAQVERLGTPQGTQQGPQQLSQAPR